jgi:phosphate transport system protein
MEPNAELTFDSIRNLLSRMAAQVEKTLALASSALERADDELAHSIIENDRIVNMLEIEIDTATYKYFALSQPKGDDLRLLFAMQKVNNHLERIGDHAVNIAESIINLGPGRAPETLYDLPDMMVLARTMLRDALHSLFASNPDLANKVLSSDEDVDTLNAGMSDKMKDCVMNGAETFDAAMELVRISKNLERIADLSTNIAEQAIFHVQALVVKHQSTAKEPAAQEANSNIAAANPQR